MDQPVTSASLRSRIIHSASFILSGHVLGQIIRLGGNLITTRLLAPDLFGVMAIVFTVVAGLEMMSDLGIHQSIIRSKNAEKLSFRRTAWVFQILRNIILAIICFIIAMILAIFQHANLIPAGQVYGDKNLPIALGIIALSTAIMGFASIDRYLADRQIKFGRGSLLQILMQLVSVITVIAWALVDPSIMALAFGTLVGQTFYAAFSHVLFYSGASRFEWNKEAASELFHFGKWLIVSSALGFITSRADKLLFGFIMTTADLGRYAIAMALIEAIKQVFIKLGHLWFPVLSEIARDRPEKFSESYYRIRKYQDIVIFLCAGGLMATGDMVIDILYDDRYAAAGWMLQIMALSMIFTVFNVKNHILLIEGKTVIFCAIKGIGAVVMLFGVPIAFYTFGIVGALLVAASVEIAGNIVVVIYFYYRGMVRPVYEVIFTPFIVLGFFLGYATKEMYYNYIII
ncbi:MAG: oligosaccharide flippase family protein [Pseudomonadota bacterium]